MKKIISVILGALLVLNLFTELPRGLLIADAASVTENGIVFETTTGTITDYTGSATTLNIPTTISGYAVKAIGSNAFRDCISLTSITIPNSVTSIGDSAFQSCESLTSITIPNSVTSIGYSAFNGCSSLTSITIPNSVTSIGSNAFRNCTLLTSISVDLTNLNYSSLDGILYNKNKTTLIRCPKGKNGIVTIPNSVTSIGIDAFYSCTLLTSITIPNSVTSIGYAAFNGCSLTSITIPNSVTSIESNAFSSCTSLTSITISSSMTSIGSSTFSSCTSLKSIIIPNSVTSIGNSAFKGCSSLTSITIPNSVTSISSDAFSYCFSLTSIIIPNSVTSIGSNVFYNCTSLTSITIPNSVTSIGSNAFQSCESLTSITIPNSVTSIGELAFYGCTSLSSITIPSSVISIGGSAFYGCTSLTSINVDVENLNYSSDNGILYNKNKTTLIQCPGRKSGNITIPNSVTSIGNMAFSSCTSLTSITISSSMTSIGSSTFSSCTKLTSIIIPNSVTSIGSGAFYNCESLTSITIPNSVTSIGNSAFQSCESLTSITIPNSVTSIGSKAFYYCFSFTSIAIPSSVTSIGSSAFYYCYSLTIYGTIGSYAQAYASSNGISFNGALIPTVIIGVEDGQFYTVNKKIYFNIGTASLNEETFISGDQTSGEGNYTLVVTDSFGFTTVVDFSIDWTAPVVTGVENNGLYNTSKTITFNDGTATLNGQPFISETTVLTDGNYILTVSDNAGNNTTVTFIIDQPQVILGVENNKEYNYNIIITIDEGTATLNGSAFTSGSTVSEEGSYIFIGTNDVGNQTTINFKIDKTEPIITIDPYIITPTNQDIVVSATTNDGSINALNYTFTANGSFDFVATDNAGNVTTKTISITNIDKTTPIITGVTNNSYYNVSKTITFNEGTAKLNGTTFVSGSSVNGEGTYTFVVTDAANNQTSIFFVIDKTSPIISGVFNNQIYDTNKAITFNEGTATLNNQPFTSGTTVNVNGVYTLIVTDNANNTTTVIFVIDIVQVITGVVNNGIYNTNVTILLNQGTATLNGVNYISGSVISEEGNYTLIATNSSGNSTTITFTIDKTNPTITINPFTTSPTNQDIVVLASANEATLNTTSHTFTENGSFEFIATDEAGNVTSHIVTITNIDKVAPVIVVSEYSTAPTNKNITITASTNKGTLNTIYHTFTANGSFEFVATDEAGNVTIKSITITNIDKVAPVIIIGEYTTAPTNQNVTVTATANEGTLNVTTYTFTENGSFNFVATDEAGNITTKTVTITNIDKIAPIVTGVTNVSSYNINKAILFSDGTATLNGVAFISGSTVSVEGKYTLVVTDLAGNITIVAFKIDKTAPKITIGSYDGIFLTSQDITVAASVNEGTLFEASHTFTENGSYQFIAIDAAGNIATKTVTITNIEKVRPIISGVVDGGIYDVVTMIEFNKGTATLNGFPYVKGDIIRTNGSYHLIVTDNYGNSSSLKFTIQTPYSYFGGKLTGIVQNTRLLDFKRNFYLNETINLFNENNIEITDNNTLMGTGMYIFINSSIYTIIISGDVSGDGIIALNDLVSIRDVLLEKAQLDGIYKSAGDMYGEGAITLNDLVGIMAIISESDTTNQNLYVAFTNTKITGKTLTNIQPGSTVNSFLNGVIIENNTRLEFKKGDVILSGSDKIGTGTVVNVYVNGVKCGSYSIVIYGDVNGDGDINFNDIIIIRDCLYEFCLLGGEYFQAGNLYGEEDLSMNDLIGIMSHFMGDSIICQNL